MNKLSKAFIASALAYFVFGTTLGLVMMLSRLRSEWGSWDYYLIPSHAHLNLLGWMSMTIYAVGYRAFPAFFGRNLYSLKLAWLHFWLANAGLAGMGIFFFFERLYGSSFIFPLIVSGTFQIAAVYIFAFNIIRSIMGKPPEDIKWNLTPKI